MPLSKKQIAVIERAANNVFSLETEMGLNLISEETPAGEAIDAIQDALGEIREDIAHLEGTEASLERLMDELVLEDAGAGEDEDEVVELEG